jgi:PhnB protein
MKDRPARAPQAIVPYLAYEDAAAAIAFLCEAFGFEERYRLEMPDGRIGHAELAFCDNVLMLASSYPELGFTSPAKLPSVHASLHIDVEDVDAHCVRARTAGATIASDPADQPHGDRSYRALDPEGHRWSFSTRVREMTPDEIRAAYGAK